MIVLMRRLLCILMNFLSNYGGDNGDGVDDDDEDDDKIVKFKIVSTVLNGGVLRID